jgi:hypothetical protein
MQNILMSKKSKKINKKTAESNKKIEDNKKPSKSNYPSGILGNFVGALGSVLGISHSTQTEKKDGKVDPKICAEKIRIYEKILKTKLKNCYMSKEIKDMREQIDSIIMTRLQKKESSNFHSSYSNGILKDEEIEKIKKEKIEKEYSDLVAEINKLNQEVIF